MRSMRPGFDLILLETVGTGQSEMDVAEVADVRVVISAPGLGDDIQAMKSGLLEIADVMVVNKGDREGAELTAAAVAGRALHPLACAPPCPYCKTTATTGEGVPELVSTVYAASGGKGGADGALARRRRSARYLIARAAAGSRCRARQGKAQASSWTRSPMKSCPDA